MSALRPRVRPRHACVLGVALALALGAPGARAQSQAPQAPPRPPQPASNPVVAPPVRLPPPPAPAASPAAARASTAAPLRPAPLASALPPDSVRPAAAAAAGTPPPDAVAQCGDGTFVLPPNDASACAAHRGLVVAFPQRTPPPAPSRTRAVAPVAASRVAAPDAAPPAGATMRCKDGTYLTGAPTDGRCDANGGLAAVLPAPRETPPPPAPRRP